MFPSASCTKTASSIASKSTRVQLLNGMVAGKVTASSKWWESPLLGPILMIVPIVGPRPTSQNLSNRSDANGWTADYAKSINNRTNAGARAFHSWRAVPRERPGHRSPLDPAAHAAELAKECFFDSQGVPHVTHHHVGVIHHGHFPGRCAG